MKGRDVSELNVLIGFEYSGIIREAFRERGFNAYSCDLLPSEIPGNHFQCDVREVLNFGWDLFIGHPPCTFLSYAGKKYWNLPGRDRQRIQALSLFSDCWNSEIEYICLENPLGIVDHVIKECDQIIHPYYFGERQMKKTCLWLKNLPKLEHIESDNLFSQKTHTQKPEPLYKNKNGKNIYFTEGLTTGHKRSKTFKSIANAMADQFGDHIIKNLARTSLDRNAAHPVTSI